MFHSARLKLTAWYLIIIMVISISLVPSSILVHLMNMIGLSELNNTAFQHPRLQEYSQKTFEELNPLPLSPQADNELVEWARLRVLEALFGINVIILFFSALAGYFLAEQDFKAD